MVIAVGTQNKAKLKACRTALQKLSAAFDVIPAVERIEIVSFLAESGVPDMPLTIKQLQDGSRNRAIAALDLARRNNITLQFSIGMEGGVYHINDAHNTFLQSWVYVTDGSNGAFGCSAGLPLPKAIAHELFENKRELAEVIDEFSGKEDVRSKEGAYGVLSRNIYTRSQAFESALINAMLPFLHHTYYGDNHGTE